MTKPAYAVIGANWGDEGKGLAVDALSASLASEGKDVLVVRSNGGAQAGHGVERPDGRRHVFHHVGAGTFAGASTHLSQFFVAHPMLFSAELFDLRVLGASPRRVTIDPRAPVTTPWDMALNQAVELQRAGGRHGSTGLGFGETLERHERGPKLLAGDLWVGGLRGKLEGIQNVWVKERAIELGIDLQNSPVSGVLDGSLPVIDKFLEDCDRFLQSVELMDDAGISHNETVLFEGAQGLQLDMDYGVFPHVTRSYTGLRNMLEIAGEAGIDVIKPLYMTRAYATRHGAGPLPFEADGTIGWADIVDLTNAPNDWQGVIRHAPLDADLLAATIARDVALAEATGIEIDAGLGVSCLDQLKSTGVVGVGGVQRQVTRDVIAGELAEIAGLPLRLSSYGPVRERVRLACYERNAATVTLNCV